MELGPGTTTALVVITLIAAIAALVTSGLAFTGQRKVQRAYRVFARGRNEDVLSLIETHIDEVTRLRNDVSALRRRTDGLRETMRGHLANIATVRYDAFDDMGGRLSFSTAIMDERGDGVVVTSINGRTETRTYAKAITGGSSRHHLSAEERTAVERAVSRDGRTPPRGSRRATPPPVPHPHDEVEAEQPGTGSESVEPADDFEMPEIDLAREARAAGWVDVEPASRAEPVTDDEVWWEDTDDTVPATGPDDDPSGRRQ